MFYISEWFFFIEVINIQKIINMDVNDRYCVKEQLLHLIHFISRVNEKMGISLLTFSQLFSDFWTLNRTNWSLFLVFLGNLSEALIR